MLKPSLVTFTGIDDHISPGLLMALALPYPQAEFGILFSPSRTGNHPRYPSFASARRFYGSGLRLSAHLCGDYARIVLTGGDLPDEIGDEIFESFQRVQFNIGALPAGVDRQTVEMNALAFADAYGIEVPIIQWTQALFPSPRGCAYLADRSGGRGERPDTWPTVPEGPGLVGYAGGITPQNVTAVLSEIAETHPPGLPFWIDMESGVRTQDRFDDLKALDVLHAIYG